MIQLHQVNSKRHLQWLQKIYKSCQKQCRLMILVWERAMNNSRFQVEDQNKIIIRTLLAFYKRHLQKTNKLIILHKISRLPSNKTNFNNKFNNKLNHLCRKEQSSSNKSSILILYQEIFKLVNKFKSKWFAHKILQMEVLLSNFLLHRHRINFVHPRIIVNKTYR
jgi:GTPase involved in cell partitioning and DNA repair